MTFMCFVQVYVGCKVYQMCVRLIMGNRMDEIVFNCSKTVCLSLRKERKKHGHPITITNTGWPSVKSINHYK